MFTTDRHRLPNTNKKVSKVRNVNNTESAVVEKEINTIDKTNPTVKVSGSINSGSSTYSNVELNFVFSLITAYPLIGQYI